MNLGPAEIFVIIIFALLIVGPSKLPQLGKAVGKAIRQFRDAQDKVNATLKEQGVDPQSVQEAIDNPFLALSKMDESKDASAGAGENRRGENGTNDSKNNNKNAGESDTNDGAGASNKHAGVGAQASVVAQSNTNSKDTNLNTSNNTNTGNNTNISNNTNTGNNAHNKEEEKRAH